MREMELTILLTEVQDIQKFTKNKRQKNGGLREISPLNASASKLTYFLPNCRVFHFSFLKSFLQFMSVTYSKPASTMLHASPVRSHLFQLLTFIETGFSCVSGGFV